eukprot:scaffold1981_cov110-Isochrysis_galbana.AAC.3
MTAAPAPSAATLLAPSVRSPRPAAKNCAESRPETGGRAGGVEVLFELQEAGSASVGRTNWSGPCLKCGGWACGGKCGRAAFVPAHFRSSAAAPSEKQCQ